MPAKSVTAAPSVDVTLSVVVPVASDGGDLSGPLAEYVRELDQLERRYELLYVIKATMAASDQAALVKAGVHLIQVPDHFGPAACISEGARRAAAGDILILPPYLQVSPTAIPMLVAGLAHADLVIASRDRHDDAPGNRLRGRLFRIVSKVAGSRFDDLGCTARASRRAVLEEIALHEAHYNFLPLLAERAGFDVVQVGVAQAASDQRYRRHGLPAYAARLLDILTVGFLVQFLQKPFRFFGSIGALIAMAGVLLGLVLVIQRATGGVPMADRPAMLLSVILTMLGIQICAVGLIGELILFTRLPANPVYRVREIVERSHTGMSAPFGTPRV
jgi:hypothetical protein